MSYAMQIQFAADWALSRIARAYSRAKRAGRHLRWLLFRRMPLLHAGRAAMVAFNGVRYSCVRIPEGDATESLTSAAAAW